MVWRAESETYTRFLSHSARAIGQAILLHTIAYRISSMGDARARVGSAGCAVGMWRGVAGGAMWLSRGCAPRNLLNGLDLGNLDDFLDGLDVRDFNLLDTKRIHNFLLRLSGSLTHIEPPSWKRRL